MTQPNLDILKHIRQIQIKTTRNVDDLFAGAYRSVFKGQGLEFEEIREYTPGDDIRHIDWNVSARMSHLFIKKFREERELTVMLVVDVSSSCRFGSQRLKSDVIAEIGAILAFSAIKNHDKVGLILFSDQIELYLTPRKGARHVLRVIRDLLYFKPKSRKTDLKAALAFLGRVQKRKAICFLISDFQSTDFSHDASLISKPHDLTAIQVYDPHEKQFPSLGMIELTDLESQDKQLIDTSNDDVLNNFKKKQEQQQDSLMRLFTRIGAGFISISCGESYVDALYLFFKWRGKNR